MRQKNFSTFVNKLFLLVLPWATSAGSTGGSGACCSETRNGEAGGEYPVLSTGGLAGNTSELVEIATGGIGKVCLGLGDTLIKI